VANFFAFALGIATARAANRSSDDQIRRGLLMGFAPSPVLGAVMSRVIEDREEPAARSAPSVALAAGTGTPAGGAVTSAAVTADDISRVEREVADIKKDVGDLNTTVETGFKELKSLLAPKSPG